MDWLCEYGSDPHCRVLACTASPSGEQAETGVPWRVPVVHGRTTPREYHPAVDMTSHNHPTIGRLASPPSRSEKSDKRCRRIGVWVSTCLWLPPMSTKPHCAYRDSEQTPHTLQTYQLQLCCNWYITPAKYILIMTSDISLNFFTIWWHCHCALFLF